MLPERCGSSRHRLSKSSSSHGWEHQFCQFLWQIQGTSPCPHPHRYHKQIPLFWGFSSKLLPGLGASPGLLPSAQSVPGQTCASTILPLPAHTPEPGAGPSCWCCPPARVHGNICSRGRAGACLVFGLWTSIPRRWNCTFQLGLARQTKDSRKFVVLLDCTTLQYTLVRSFLA